MPVHRHQPQILFIGQERLAYREKIIRRLTRQRNAGPDAGVDEQVIALSVGQSEALQPRQMGWGQGSFPLIARQVR